MNELSVWLAEGVSLAEAGARLGVTRQAVSARMSRDPGLRAAFEAGRLVVAEKRAVKRDEAAEHRRAARREAVAGRAVDEHTAFMERLDRHMNVYGPAAERGLTRAEAAAAYPGVRLSVYQFARSGWLAANGLSRAGVVGNGVVGGWIRDAQSDGFPAHCFPVHQWDRWAAGMSGVFTGMPVFWRVVFDAELRALFMAPVGP